ncbi:MAG: DUF4399 domain-containing protein [Caldilineaceae bacterium]
MKVANPTARYYFRYCVCFTALFTLLLLTACGSDEATAEPTQPPPTATAVPAEPTATPVPAEPTSTPEPAADSATSKVFFVEPTDGASVSSPFSVTMGVENFTLEPVGEVKEGFGHLHITVNDPCTEAGQPIPKDATHLHYGQGQSEATLDLLPGDYTLCLQAADGAHVALPGAEMQQEITVTVTDYTAPHVFFIEPQDGVTVTSPFSVTMGVENFTLEPAGEVTAGAGHLHITVDGDCTPAGEPIPKDETHIHFGNGQSEATLALAPGEHTLCLQSADGAHVALPGAHVTQMITVTVE